MNDADDKNKLCSHCGEDEANCYCHKCETCGSTNTQAYDDGEGYPPNIKCNDCGHWD